MPKSHCKSKVRRIVGKPGGQLGLNEGVRKNALNQRRTHYDGLELRCRDTALVDEQLARIAAIDLQAKGRLF